MPLADLAKVIVDDFDLRKSATSCFLNQGRTAGAGSPELVCTCVWVDCRT
jgi:hypothetical protein